MNVYKYIEGVVRSEIERLAAAEKLPAGLDFSRVSVEPPRDPEHGDLATNAAMVLAKDCAMLPRDLAALLAEGVAVHDQIASAQVAGPGFVNLRLEAAFWRARVAEILAAGTAYGDSDMGGGRPVNVEYVSANPTGPMHVGHGRGAVVGDALASLLEKAGFRVTREYYINDAGAQVDALAYAAYWRYLEALGDKVPKETMAEFLRQTDLQYRGDYLVPVGTALAAAYGDELVGAAASEWLPVVQPFTVDAMMELIRADLAALGMKFDVFTSERELVEKGAIDAVVAALEDRGLVYRGRLDPPKGKLPDDWEDREQTLFRATRFGDDVDRPLRKSDESWTYFASDIAYHQDKFRRGFDTMVDVWGTDHKGYVKRMQAAVRAVSEDTAALEVRLCNLVNLLEAGKPVQMSKRAGTFVRLADVTRAVGADVVRFMMLTRNNEAALDFDLVTVTEQSRDNPVFYVQYAHARVCSLLRNAAQAFPHMALDDSSLAKADLSPLNHEQELAMIKLLAGWPRLVEAAAEAKEPHRIAFFLIDFAAAFHGFWTRGNEDESLRFIMPGDEEVTRARLALARAVALVIASGLAVMGVTPVEEMR